MDLLQRLKTFKAQTGATYKFVMKECGINEGVWYLFTSGRRQLKPEIAEKVDKFLTEKGY